MPRPRPPGSLAQALSDPRDILVAFGQCWAAAGSACLVVAAAAAAAAVETLAAVVGSSYQAAVGGCGRWETDR